MRTLMTLATLGAAGAGYVYLNRTPAACETFPAKAEVLSLFDWHRDASSTSRSNRVAAKDLFQKVHDHTQSVLDGIADQHGGHSDAPVDDAFQRLQQVTQSAVLASHSGELTVREVSNTKQSSVVPLPSLDELQRTAFDPAAEPPSTNPAKIQPAQARDDATSTAEAVANADGNSREPNPNAASPSTATDSSVTRSAAPVTKTSQPTEKPNVVRTTVSKPNRADPDKVAYEWKVVGRTAEGLPMHTTHFGDGGTRTLIIAGLSGEDRTAVRWLELLADELSRHPEMLKNNEIVFFRAGNPDGLVHQRRENSRGVLINRNFPSRRYRPSPNAPGNAAPAGEVETRAILETLYSFRPRRLVHLSSTAGRSTLLFNRAAKKPAMDFERSAQVTIAPLDAEQYPGSIEDFCEGTLEAAVLSMRLSSGNDWSRAWNNLQPHVLKAVVGDSSESAGGQGEQIFDPDRTPIPQTSADPVSRQPRRRGYEELPPPPD